MKLKKIPYMLLVLLIFSLIITGCNAAQRPNVTDTDRRPDPMESNTDTGPNSGTEDQPRVQNDALVNDKNTRDNKMPDQPDPVTPTSEAGFSMDQINEFLLNMELVNNDEMYMVYKKGPNNEGSKIESIFDGKKSVSEHGEASRQIEQLLSDIPGSSIADTNKIIDGTLSSLKVKREDVEEFDMMFLFETGEKVEIELNDDPED